MKKLTEKQFRTFDFYQNAGLNRLPKEEYTLEQWKLKKGTYAASALYKISKRCGAIYHLWDDKKLKYIGQTVRDNFYIRPSEHVSRKYNRISIQQIPKDLDIDILESLLIIHADKTHLENKFEAEKGVPVDRKELWKMIELYKKQVTLGLF